MNKGKKTDSPIVADEATVRIVTACSGEGWAAPVGLYRCDEKRAAMLIRRGYAVAVEAKD